MKNELLVKAIDNENFNKSEKISEKLIKFYNHRKPSYKYFERIKSYLNKISE